VAPLQIVKWEQGPMPNEDGVELFGEVRNTGTSHMTNVTVTAILYGEEGGMLANGDATLNQPTIAPGGSSNFRIEFPGLADFASVKFTTSARGFETRPPETEGEEQEAAPPAEVPPPASESAAAEASAAPPPAR
jgi:hypothetical protein